MSGFRRYGRIAIGVALVLATAHAATVAGAAPAGGTEEADALFEEGRRLMDEGSLAEACPKLERSFQLAPRLGAMLNLGSCFERRGELARALAIYERAATLARQLGRADREAAARELAVALESKVGKLLVIVKDPAPQLTIQVDGAEMLSTRSGLVPLDPGPRRFVARAPGRAPFETQLVLRAGETTTLEVPRLNALPPPPAAAESPARGGGLRTTVAIGGFGLAAAAITAGSIFGLRAIDKDDASTRFCDGSGCTREGLALVDEAQTAGNLSTAFFVGGVIALGATIVYLLR